MPSMIASAVFFLLGAYSSFVSADSVTESEAPRAELRAALDGALRYGSSMSPPISIEQSLWPMFQAAPKNSYGRVEAMDAGGLVQRHFLKEHSWQIAGLRKEYLGQPTPEGADLWFVDLLMRVDPTGRGFTVGDLSKVAFALERTVVQDRETASSGLTEQARDTCAATKEALAQLTQSQQGRVPLDAFSALEVATVVKESLAVLQESGAVVDVGGTPYLLVPNYMLLPSNCIASGSYHSVCCESEGEVLMRNIELEVQGPAPSAEQLLRVIPGLVSKSFAGHHRFTRRLAKQLKSIAEDNHGTVPLHDAAFANWLHEAFPNEFPLPWPRTEQGGVDSSSTETEQVQAAAINFREIFLMIAAVGFALFRYAASQMQGAKPAPATNVVEGPVTRTAEEATEAKTK